MARGTSNALNKITDALAQGISEEELRSLLSSVGVSEAGVQEVLSQLDTMGAAFETAPSAPLKPAPAAPAPKTAAPAAPGAEIRAPIAPDSALPNPAEQQRPSRTGGTIQIPAKKVVRFKAGSELASKVSRINQQREEFRQLRIRALQDIKSASPEEREKIINELKENRKALRENAQVLRQNIRESAQELRNNLRKRNRVALVGFGSFSVSKRAHIAAAHGRGLRMLNRFRSAITRFDHILGRLESRTAKLEARGGDVSLVIPLIEESKNMIVENEAKMEELKAKYESLLEGENPRGVGEEARAIAKELKAEIENLQAKLREIVDEIKQAAGNYSPSLSNKSTK